MKRRVRSWVGILGFASIVGCLIAFASLASAQPNSSKPYSLVICGDGQTGCTSSNPAVTAPGGTTTNPAKLSVTLRNDNKLGSGIRVGSDNLNVPNPPSGFSVISTSLPACATPLPQQGLPCAYLLDSSGNVVSSGATTVGLRNLNLQPGQSISLTMSLITPAPSTTDCTTTSPCSWTDQAKQANDFIGTGNGLNPDSSSSYGTVTDAVASCPKNGGKCTTQLADGGNSTGGAGTVDVTVSTGSGKTAVTQIEALDFGTPLDTSLCGGVTSMHEEFWTLGNGGSDRSQTVTITTTFYSGYQAQVCYFTTKQFTALQIDANGNATGLASATPTTVDGVAGFQGLLADCGSKPLPPNTVDCNKNPGLAQRGTDNGDGTRTTVIAVPPGFDAHSYQ
jgi:hypothetical protein